MATTRAVDEMTSFLKYLETGLIQRDPTVLGIVIAIIIGFLTIVFFIIRSGKSKRDGILITGICEAGKTLLFTRLLYNVYKETYTSMEVNKDIYNIPNNKKKLQLIDLPGHDRLRKQSLDKNKNFAKAMIFVIDSVTFQKDIKEVAEYLYTLLSDGTLSQNVRPVLIACNKHDQTFAKGSKVIQSQLEKEMTLLRITRSAALQGTDGSSSNSNAYLGKKNKDFEFAELKPFKVEFAECAFKGSDGSACDIEQIQSWLSGVA